MGKQFLAGVGSAIGLDNVGNMILKGKALTDSGFNISTNKEEVRGGESAALQGQYFHTTQFGVTLKDALTDLNYLALQVGGQIEQGGDVFKTEKVVVEKKGQITVTGTPKKFGNYGIIGWYSPMGKDTPKTITFTEKTAQASEVQEGDVLCVTYVETSDSARAFKVATSYIPAEIHLIITLPLFNAGAKDKTTIGTDSKIGEYIVDIPRFQFNGNVDMSTAMASASGVDISGMALQSGVSDCSGKGIYATITENIYNRNPLDNTYAIVVEDGNIELKTGESQTLRVLALHDDNTAPSLMDNSKLTFTIAEGGQSFATVGANTGVVKATGEGKAIVEIAVTEKKELSSRAVVTVTGA